MNQELNKETQTSNKCKKKHVHPIIKYIEIGLVIALIALVLNEKYEGYKAPVEEVCYGVNIVDLQLTEKQIKTIWPNARPLTEQEKNIGNINGLVR